MSTGHDRCFTPKRSLVDLSIATFRPRSEARLRHRKPGLSALLAGEFDDTVRFTGPPRALQKPLFAALAPLARLRGLRGSFPTTSERWSSTSNRCPKRSPPCSDRRESGGHTKPHTELPARNGADYWRDEPHRKK